jgi:hypothetical protein
MKCYRVAPDGALLDRASEFALAKRDRIRILFHTDPSGYSDAVAKLVQTLACSEKIVIGNRRVPATTVRLREQLARAGRHEESDFFNPTAVELRRTVGYEWLSKNWDKICDELNDPESSAESGIAGHLQREFYYYWLHEDPNWNNWNSSWYAPEDAILHLPSGVLHRLQRSVTHLARSHDVEASETAMTTWIEQTVTTHFRIFAEYWLHLGRETGDEYMPAFSRSSLRFLSHPTRHGSVESLVMPFVGMAALSKVTHRGDLVERVAEWSEDDGKEIVQGLFRLQEVARTIRNEDERKKLFSEVEDILAARLSRTFKIALNLIRLLTEAAAKKMDIQAAETTALSMSRSYRWLWQIRNPELRECWRIRLQELLN